eukprot:scaffold20447_cov200-Amphora_coffeaeformis.AAC.9
MAKIVTKKAVRTSCAPVPHPTASTSGMAGARKTSFFIRCHGSSEGAGASSLMTRAYPEMFRRHNRIITH